MADIFDQVAIDMNRGGGASDDIFDQISPEGDIFDHVESSQKNAITDIESKAASVFGDMPKSERDFVLYRLDRGDTLQNIQKELGGTEEPWVNPIDVGTSTFGAGAKIAYSAGKKIIPALFRGATAAVPAMGMEYPIGATADYLAENDHPGLAFLTSLGVGITSGLTVERLAEKGLLGLTNSLIDQFPGKASKLLPQDFIKQVKTSGPFSEWSPEIADQMQSKAAKWRAKAQSRMPSALEDEIQNRSGGAVIEDIRAGQVKAPSIQETPATARTGSAAGELDGTQPKKDIFDEIAPDAQPYFVRVLFDETGSLNLLEKHSGNATIDGVTSKQGPGDIPTTKTSKSPMGGKILKDALGQPTPEALISQFGGKYGKGGYYAISASSNLEAPRFETHQQALDWAKNNGFRVKKAQKDGYNAPFFIIEHIETQKILEKVNETVAHDWDSGKDIFVRYGDIPKSGKSWNSQAQGPEKGVSVFRGRLLKNGEILVKPTNHVDTSTFHILSVSGRPVHVVEGREVGIGADGEPLLSGVKKLSRTQAIEKYFSQLPDQSAPPLGGGSTLYLHPSTITGPVGGIAAGVDWEEYQKSGQVKIDPKRMFIGAVTGFAAPSAIKRSRQLVHSIMTKWDEKAAEPFIVYLKRKANGMIINEDLRYVLGHNRSQKFEDLLRNHNRDVETSWNKALALGEELQKIAPTKLEQKRLMQVIRGGVTASAPLKAKAEKVNQIFAELRKDLEKYQLLEYSRFDELSRKQRAKYRDIVNHPEKYKATPDDIEWARSRLHDHYHFGSAEEYAPLYYKKHEGLSPHEKKVIENEIHRLKVKSRRGNPEGEPALEEMIAKLQKMVRGGKQGRKELKISRQQLALNYSHRREEISPELQKMLGVIDEAAFPVAKMVGVQATDVLKGKLFKSIADNPEWARTGTRIHKPDGTTFIKRGTAPANFVEIADERFGALNGKFVRNDIWSDLKEIEEWRGDIGRLYDKALGSWKYGMVVLNPSSHARNFMTNIMLAYLGDVSPADVKTYAKAVRALRRGEGDSLYKEAANWGLFNNTYVTSEIGKLRDQIDTLRDGKSIQNFIRSAVSLPADIYQGNEKLFKLAVFIKARETGASVDDAARKAEKFIFNYADIPPWVKVAKRWAIPFITFSYKAFPLMAEMAIRKPHKVAAIAAALYGAEEYSRRRLGYDDDEYEQKRGLMPDWQKRRMLAFLPDEVESKIPRFFNPYLQVLAPFLDKWGNPLTLDLSYILPFGNMSEKWGQSAVPFSDFLPSSPLFNILGTIAFNRDAFTGKEIYNEYLDGTRQIAQKYLEFVYHQLAPPMAPGGYGWNKLATGLKNALNPDRQETDWADRPIELSTAVLSSIMGIKLTPANEKKLQLFEAGIRTKIQRSIGAEISKLKRDLQHNKITEAEFKTEVRKLMDLEKGLIEARPKIK